MFEKVMKSRMIPLWSCSGLLMVLSGCFGSTGDSVAPRSQGEDSSLPYVEAMIEYPGPHEKWAGPQNFIIHLNTKSVGRARVEISTSIFKAESGSTRELKPVTYGLTPEAGREQIARLSVALRAQESSVSGCLLPVRVRLIRADGVIVAREGCRGQAGWPQVASEVTSHLIESALASKSEESEPQPHSSPQASHQAQPAPSATVSPVATASPIVSPVASPSSTPAHEHPTSMHSASAPSPVLAPSPIVTPEHSKTH
jgi:hypothetical protein